MSENCLFCSIVLGKAEASIVYEDDRTLAFVDPRQFHPGHVLMIPKHHVPDIRDLAAADAGPLMAGIDSARRRITGAIRKWADRRQDKDFMGWLRNKLDWPRRAPGSATPYHAATIKLGWYLELAVAQASGNEGASYDFLPVLRDALSAPLPMMVAVDEDGYMTTTPPESGG
jgi:hypothetical protein